MVTCRDLLPFAEKPFKLVELECEVCHARVMVPAAFALAIYVATGLNEPTAATVRHQDDEGCYGLLQFPDT